MSRARIYLDHHGASPLLPEAAAAMVAYLEEPGTNPGSVHREGRRAARFVSEARQALGALLGCKASEVVFTASQAEANNLALIGGARAQRAQGYGAHLIAVATEHDSVLEPLRSLEDEGFELSVVGVDAQGRWEAPDLLEACRPDTVLVSASVANYELGTLGPVAELSAALAEHQAVLHCDASVASGWLDLDVNTMGVNLLTVSSPLLGGPAGAAALFVRRDTRLEPLIRGGYQERGRRPGMEAPMALAGFGAAARSAKDRGDEDRRRVTALRDSLWEGLQALNRQVIRLGAPGLPGCLNISFPGLEGESLLLTLDMEGVAVSSGAACSSGTLEPSHAVKALGVAPEVAQGSLRLSLGFSTSDDEVREALVRIGRVISRLDALVC